MTRPLRWRRAELEDMPELVALLNEIAAWLHDVKGVSNQWRRECPEDAVRRRVEAGEVYLTFLGRELVGTVTLIDQPDHLWTNVSDTAVYVHTLGVRRSHAGKGFGLQTLRWIESFARERQREFVRLDCFSENDRLHQYYVEAGYDALGPSKTDPRFALFQRPLNEDERPN